MEEVKGERWKGFRARHGDGGRNLELSLGRRESGLTLKTLAEAAAMRGEASVAVALQRYQERLARDRNKSNSNERPDC